LEAAALIMAVEARSAAALTVVGGAGEEGGGAFVGGGIASEALAVGSDGDDVNGSDRDTFGGGVYCGDGGAFGGVDCGDGVAFGAVV
jgi:hypothetical protein